MKKNFPLLFVLLLSLNQVISAQQTEVKNHQPWPYIGSAKLNTSWGEYGGKYSEKIFQVEIPQDGGYQLKFSTTLLAGENLELWVNGIYSGKWFTGSGVGWETFATSIFIQRGINNIAFRNGTYMVPLAEILQLDWIDNWKTTPADIKNKTPLAEASPAANETARVLPNPAGNYSHDIETAFSYTTYAWVYLKKNTPYTFATSNTKNADPVLHLFHPGNMATMSWMNDNANTGTIESRITMTPTLEGYYQLVVRGTKSISAATNAYTDLFCNNAMLVQKARIGGNLFKSSIGATTDSLNFFTCRLNSKQADTRLLLMNGQNFNANFYNDDYGIHGGNWQWDFSSRINSDWPTGYKPFSTFVSAYSPFSEGVADTYMGNRNSVAWTFFANWKKDDCIQAGVGYPLQPNPYYYNCIGWSGGLTNGFYWPGSYFSTWTVYGNELASFDNYYGNTPARYPGAYTYSRTGANWSNAVVDLWATTNGGTGLYYTHGSVTKPGNNNPHGYDWDSKPGSTERSFHPRLGPAGETVANYGTPVNHYIHTGAFARLANANEAYGTADEAVQAGVAVYDNPSLSEKAQLRLQEWTLKVDGERKTRFNQLYENWEKTWVANAVQSNPAAYCRNTEYKQLEQWCLENKKEALWMLCSRFVAGDYLCETPLCAVSLKQYAYLLEEVKTEYKSNLYNRDGKYRIRSDYDNGIAYIEKLLTVIPPPEPVAVVENAGIIISPNPVKDQFTVKLNILETARVSIKAISTQTRAVKILQPEKELAPGNYQYTMNANGFAGSTGDMITIQLVVDGVLKTVKVMVAK
jgi:hypothetical protein